jgi:hypothetical protein
LDKDKEEEKKKSLQLLKLRNSIAFWFGILNGLLILFVLIIESHESHFDYKFYFGNGKEHSLNIDFIEIILLSVFGVVLLIQVFGMLSHRLKTFFLLIASTDLNFFNDKSNLEENGPSSRTENNNIQVI